MFEFTRNFYSPAEEVSESSFTPGQVIILEQTVSTSSKHPSDTPHGNIIKDHTVVPDKLLIEFNGTEYIVEKKTFHDSGALLPIDVTYYGEMVGNKCSFNTYPFYIEVSDPSWILYTESEGTYTISAKIPEEKSAWRMDCYRYSVPSSVPKVLSFPKGRTIVSELSRINKAFGTISKKKTIIGQLSDIADAAEAGKIGGGSGALIVDGAINPEDDSVTLDKTWQEIYDAMTDNTLVWIKVVPTIPNVSGVFYSQVLSAQSYKTPVETGDGEMKYTVGIIGANGSELTMEAFICDSADGYPRMEI